MATRQALAMFMAIAALAPALPAAAETSAWAPNEGGRMRLTALPPAPDGTIEALLEIEPKPGWITYWREPGASGIPPQISVTEGGALASIAYPVPKVLTLGELTDIGYDAPVALPLTLKEGSGGPLKLDAFIGICNEICIPFQASFSLSPSGPVDPGEAARLQAASTALPAAPGPDFAVKAAREAGETLVLDLALPFPDQAAEAILTGPEGYVFTAAASGSQITIPIPGLPKGTDARTHDWRVLVKNGSRSIETAFKVE